MIPVLLYHGKGRWKYQTLANLFDDLEEDWKRYLPDFDYIYNDLGALTDNAIAELNNKFLAASFLTLKHTFEKAWIEQNAVELLLLADSGPKGLQRGFIIYLYSRGKLSEKVLNSLPDSIKKGVMNTLDIYIEKGRKEGFEQGKNEKEFDIVENLITKLGLNDQQAAEIAEVPLSFVKKIRNTLRKKK